MTESEWLSALGGDATNITVSYSSSDVFNTSKLGNMPMCDCKYLTTNRVLKELCAKIFDNKDDYPEYYFVDCDCMGAYCEMCK